MILARIYVCLKPNVLDPQGKAVTNSLRQLGYASVAETRVSKYIEISFDTSNREQAKLETERICRDLLANPNTEHYSFTLEDKEGGKA
ncbi:MAG: phosphoribosylformylglycinamidine synthase subunit PurS [Candidatus Cloacimonetes bacterium]|nr:phosphoribosylformylglycinamidine synthase subunit PurS [Candidatus Cloacimonadota bacterium]